MADGNSFRLKGAKENLQALENDIRRMYSLTEDSCAGCMGPIAQNDKEFIETNTDLDGVYYCKNCWTSFLKKCQRCELLTQTDVCKNCRAKEPENEIL